MRVVIFLWCIFNVVLFASDKENYQEKNTGLNFSPKVGVFARTYILNKKLYQTIFIGYSKGDTKLTCYIYATESNDLKKAFARIKLELYLAKEQGLYEDVQFISQEEYKVKKILGFKGVYNIKIEKQQNRSLAYLFQFGGYLFKVRVSFLEKDKVEKDIDDFVNKIIEAKGKPQEKKPPSTLDLIDSFLENPLEDEVLMKRLLLFAVNSDKVEIKISPDTVPGIKTESRFNGILLAAYIVGNARAQLLKKTKKDMPKEGQKAMLEVYKVLKEYSFTFHNKELDKLLNKALKTKKQN